jgi:hypothetical protein
MLTIPRLFFFKIVFQNHVFFLNLVAFILGRVYFCLSSYNSGWWPGSESGRCKSRDYLRSRLESWDGHASERTRVARGTKKGRDDLSFVDHRDY